MTSLPEGVNHEFLRTLLTANVITWIVTISLSTLGGVALALWRRRMLKRQDEMRRSQIELQAREELSRCYHCRLCGGYLRGVGDKHVLDEELCSTCAKHPTKS